MKAPIWVMIAVVLVVMVGTYYVSKHYNFSKLAEATGTNKDSLVVAAATK